MLELRTILAVVSLLSGAALLLIGTVRVVRRVPARTQSTGSRLVVVYGSLFVVAALVLMYRGRDAQETAASSDLSPPTIAEQLPSDPVEPIARDSIASAKPIQKFDQADSLSEIAASSRVDREDRETIPFVREKRPQPTPRVKHIQQPVKAAPPPRTIEDRMYLAVSRAFDSVEAWFMKHGSPSPDHADMRVEISEIAVNAENSELQFPAIAFESGTADLQPQSVEALKNLAEHLNRLPTPARLEVQARVDSIGPEPFNYLLTKARVEAVCEVLTREGVGSHRLIARALGSQRDDSTKTGAQIQFVVCP